MKRGAETHFVVQETLKRHAEKRFNEQVLSEKAMNVAWKVRGPERKRRKVFQSSHV